MVSRGYWAEREIAVVDLRRTTPSKLFSWRSRSLKSISDPPGRRIGGSDDHGPSPKSLTPKAQPFMTSAPNSPSLSMLKPATPMSPYASEEAHVASLQGPSSQKLREWSESSFKSTRRGVPRAEMDDISPLDVVFGVQISEEKEVVATATTGLRRTLLGRTLLDRLQNKSPARLPSSPASSKSDLASNDSLPHGCSPPEKAPVENGADPLRAVRSLARSASWLKGESGSNKFGKRWFGKAPWHRKESGASAMSAASSVRGLLAGSTPPVTPSKEMQLDYYTSGYPGGEATRIKTPPLVEDSATGHPRSFFSQTRPPGNLEGADSWTVISASQKSSPRSTTYSQEGGHLSKTKEWWEAMPSKPVRRNPTDSDLGVMDFEFDLPEHLPTSPTCPANSKHESRGLGVCVYHGRGKGASGLRKEFRPRREGSEVSITNADYDGT